ncbi:MAG: hypothetical protein LUH22_18760 [Bacteroides sp.]|nr:hypothetical protein [Bacteroides sp.]
MKKTTFILLLLFSIIVKTHAQNLFPETFDGCSFEAFHIESKITTARISSLGILGPLMEEKSLSNIEGVLMMQVYVDIDGQACLISADNQTNIPTKEFNLENAVRKTKWTNGQKAVCAIVHITFEDAIAEVRRLGINRDLGVHEITDEPNPLYEVSGN